jgi:hypothetical protein
MASLGAETTFTSELAWHSRVWAVRLIMTGLAAIEASTTALTMNTSVWAFGFYVAVERDSQ